MVVSPKLLRIHLTKTFVTLKHHLVAVAVAIGINKTLHLLLIPCILLNLILTLCRALIEWRRSDIEIAVLDYRTDLCDRRKS